MRFGRRRLPIDENVKTAILQFLQSGRELGVHERILLQARELLTMQGDYEMSVITSGTAFEVFLQNRLVQSCQSTQTQTLPDRSKKAVDYPEAIETGNVQADLLKFVDLLAPAIAPVRQRSQYLDWKMHAYDIRNKIVHRGQRGITESQAKDAFRVVQDFMTYLNANLP